MYKIKKWTKIKTNKDLPDPKKYDWVLVAPLLIPEGFYGVPIVAEYRDGKWWNDCDQDIEKELSVKITHWIPAPLYNKDMIFKKYGSD